MIGEEEEEEGRGQRWKIRNTKSAKEAGREVEEREREREGRRGRPSSGGWARGGREEEK